MRRLLCLLLEHDWSEWLPWKLVFTRWRYCYRCRRSETDWGLWAQEEGKGG